MQNVKCKMPNVKLHLVLSSLIIFCCFFSDNLFAQTQNVLEPEELATKKTFFNLQEAIAQPDSVYKLNLSKKKLKEIPHEVFSFHNLQILNLSRNNIAAIPVEIGILKSLQELDLSRNALTQLPPEIGQLKNLSNLKLNRNKITSLPMQVGDLLLLENLEMWDNELDTVPDDIQHLARLKTFELRGILFSDEQQKRIQQLLPNTKIYFSPSCACKE